MASTSSTQPPYVSFGIFNTAIETLAQSIVPTGPLDRRVLDKLSGADYGSLMSGLRFLGLVDDNKKATQTYRELVQASKEGGDSDKYKTALSDIIFAAYQSITGELDLDNGTIAQLERAFKDAGVSQGQMLAKTIRFYLKAVAASGKTISPHITKANKTQRAPASKKNGEKRTRVKKPKPGGNDGPESDIGQLPSGFERLPLPGVPGAFIQYPAAITDAHCDLFVALVGVLRAHAKGRSGRKEKP
jgi:hypothetical protein